MRFYGTITKIDDERRMVWGYASTETEDSQGEIVKRDALEAALADYMRFANIREMHLPSAVGIATEAVLDDKGLYLGAKIIDDDAWQKVVEGVYKGFSIGGKVTARDQADRKVITGISLSEISIVDRPANPEAVFDCWKAAAAEPLDLDVDYADPGYRADGEKRYPLDTEAHIRTAWAYIHQPGNAAEYTPAQLAHIKERIVAAWERRIDSAGPPSARAETDDQSGNRATPPADDFRLLIQQAHDQLCQAGAHCHPSKGEAEREAAESDREKVASHGDLAKMLSADVVSRLDALAKRVEDIAQTPLPPVTMARHAIGLSKREDGSGTAPSPDDLVAALARMSGEERTLTLIKAAHATPVRPTPSR